MVSKCNCQRCNNDVVKVYTRLCEECQREFLEDYYKEQDKLMQEEFESIKISRY